MILLGDIGQVEKLAKGAGHRQQLVITQPVERVLQQLGPISRATARAFGALANALDLVEEGIAVLLANCIAQQLAEQMNVFAQTRVNLRHVRLSFTGRRIGRT